MKFNRQFVLLATVNAAVVGQAKCGGSSLQGSYQLTFPTRPDSKCGLVQGKVFGCETGECCSEFGFCGKSKAYCNEKSIDLGALVPGNTSTSSKTTTTSSSTEGAKATTSSASSSAKTTTSTSAGASSSSKTTTTTSDGAKVTTTTTTTTTSQGSKTSSSATATTSAAPTTLPVRANGQCGFVNDKLFGCNTGECCSEFGFCGTGKEYCNAKSIDLTKLAGQTSSSVSTKTSTSVSKTTSSATTTSDASTTSTVTSTSATTTTSGSNVAPTNLPIKANGQCGIVGGKLFGCKEGECCSEFGFCGAGKQYCNAKSIDLTKLAGQITSSSDVVTSTTSSKTTTTPAVTSSTTTTSQAVTATSNVVGSPTPLPTIAPAISAALKATIIQKCVQAGMIAMTFDDGPSANIPALLTKLDQLGVKGTFFVNGNNFANFINPKSADAKLVKSIFDKGHQIGTHTFTHADLAKLSVQGIWDEMRLNDEAIRRIIGVRPTHLRAPFLSTNDKVLTAVGSFGYKVIGINMDTKDYEHNNAATQVQLNLQSINPVLKGANSATSSFISLNHDFTSQISQWMDTFVPLMKNSGYRFVTSAECVGDVNPYRP